MMTPAEITNLIGENAPTDEQTAVITADLSRPHLVVAGAGSGKTATMANRVVYLVANKLVQPGEVLGLTFTRKAAGELEERIHRYLDKYDVVTGAGQGNTLEAERPEVSTYNSFAAAVYRDHALRIGYEPDAVVIPESIAWRLAHEVVTGSTDDRLADFDGALSTLVDAVLALAREMADHNVDPDDVAAFAEKFARQVAPALESIPQKNKREPLAKVFSSVATLPILVDLTKQYQAAKRARGYIEFSDQVSLAHRIITEHPDVAEGYRARYRAVLLDEYQDTSVSQTRFLSELFAGTGVMAVGDPDQSIYGFRGASAANLSRFRHDFGAGETFQLTVSWRNAHTILAAANATSDHIERTAGVVKHPLRAHDNTIEGTVSLTFDADVAAEAETVATWMKDRVSRADSEGKLGSAALLFRTKRHFGVFAAALRAQGIPVHVLGLSGLLSEPVITDLVAAISVLHDPTANAELLRLLAGARWAIGPADIRALHELASQIASHDEHGRLLSSEQRSAKRNSFEEIDTSSLVDALDAVATDTVAKPEWLERFSAVGLERMRQAGTQFAALRRRISGGLSDLVELVIAELELDVEAHANESSLSAHNALEAFHGLVSDFSTFATSSSLSVFLDWLEDVERKESIAPRQEEPEPGTVQIMTVHAAKGLEWDYVAVARMVADEFPFKSLETNGWMQLGRLPYAFRGDRNELPHFDIASVKTPDDLLERFADFKAAIATHHNQEEWRLGYVAVTRPRHELLLTGSHWAGQKNPRLPSEISAEIASSVPAVSRSQWLETAPEMPVSDATGQSWPLDPLGERAAAVHEAAAVVGSASPEQLEDGDLKTLITRMLRERDDESSRTGELPVRIPASRVKDFVSNSQAVLAELRRPMPQQPFTATRLGTLFHSWVEHRASSPIEIDSFDQDLDLGDAVSSDQFEKLKATFERSVWGPIKPLDVEREIHLPLAGNIFICKIDAVYDAVAHPELASGPDVRYQVVDWKTGKAPSDAADLALKQHQLTLYRLAYAKHLGIPAEQVDAVFYFVADNEIVTPSLLLSEDEFIAEWRELFD